MTFTDDVSDSHFNRLGWKLNLRISVEVSDSLFQCLSTTWWGDTLQMMMMVMMIVVAMAILVSPRKWHLTFRLATPKWTFMMWVSKDLWRLFDSWQGGIAPGIFGWPSISISTSTSTSISISESKSISISVSISISISLSVSIYLYLNLNTESHTVNPSNKWSMHAGASQIQYTKIIMANEMLYAYVCLCMLIILPFKPNKLPMLLRFLSSALDLLQALRVEQLGHECKACHRSPDFLAWNPTLLRYPNKGTGLNSLYIYIRHVWAFR